MADRRYSLWNLRWNIKLQQLVDMYFPIGWPKYFSSKDVHCGELKSLKYNRDRSLLAVVSDHSVCIWNNRVNMKLNIYVHVILKYIVVVFLLSVHFNIPFSLILALVFIIHIQIPSQTTCLIYSYFEKGCRKKCTRQTRKVLWVVLSALFFKEIWKNGTGGHGHMFASAKGKQQKYVRQLQSSGTMYWSYPVLPFGIVACTFFPTTFLEIAVYPYTKCTRMRNLLTGHMTAEAGQHEKLLVLSES